MTSRQPRTSGNLPRALIGLLTLELALLKENLVSFRWPQDVDSGIDLVSFVVSPDEIRPGTPLATSFVAGFQSKATQELFTKTVTESELKKFSKAQVALRHEPEPQKDLIGNHRDYWMTATMPVFIAAIDGNGLILVEDTRSYLYRYPDATNVEMVKQITEVSSDIRLRMITHALAPWISSGLRRHLLGRGIDQYADTGTIWALLANQLAFSDAITARTWSQVHEYFALVRFLIDDKSSRDQLCVSLTDQPNLGRAPMGLHLLQHLIDMYLQYQELISTAPHSTPKDTQAEMNESISVILRILREAEVCLDVNTQELANTLLQIETSSELRSALQEIKQRPSLQDALWGFQGTWRKAHPEIDETLPSTGS